MSGDVFLQILPSVLVEGLLLGSVYAMIALGYTMVYGVLGLINFAHSEVFMIGGVTGVEIFRHLQPHIENPYILLLASLLTAGVVSGLTAGGVEFLAYRPLRRRGSTNRLVPLITAIGVSFFLQDFIRLIEGLWHNEFFLNYPSLPALDRNIEFTANLSVQVKSIIVFVVAIGMMIALQILVNRTRMGKAIRAVAQDAQTARLMGINPDRIISRTFMIGGALGGIAGVLFGILYTKIDPFVGFLPGIRAFTAAVLGGIGNIPGAMLGGIILGQLETAAGFFLPILTDGKFGTEYKDIFGFLVLVLLLLFRPEGLLGKKQGDRP